MIEILTSGGWKEQATLESGSIVYSVNKDGELSKTEIKNVKRVYKNSVYTLSLSGINVKICFPAIGQLIYHYTSNEEWFTGSIDDIKNQYTNNLIYLMPKYYHDATNENRDITNKDIQKSVKNRILSTDYIDTNNTIRSSFLYMWQSNYGGIGQNLVYGRDYKEGKMLQAYLARLGYMNCLEKQNGRFVVRYYPQSNFIVDRITQDRFTVFDNVVCNDDGQIHAIYRINDCTFIG